jgi:acetoacetyl-CoA synthetase
MNSTREGNLLWQPSRDVCQATNIARYMSWLDSNGYGRHSTYENLWEWSVSDIPAFWESIWRFCEVRSSHSYSAVLTDPRMPGAIWFEGARLNYAEHLFRHATSSRPAILFRSEAEPLREVSWKELSESTAAFSAGLRNLGVRPGDRVVAVMPNIPETVIAFLAVTSIGAIWSACSPDFGAAALIDRFRQIEPTVLIAVDGYRYKGKSFDRLNVINELRTALPTLRCTVLLPNLDAQQAGQVADGVIRWSEMVSRPGDLQFEQVAADHPLWIVFTSGTTGLPKPIVHGHAGILLERLKASVLHGDLRPEDIYFWYTTTSWIMWNLTVSAWLGCSTIALFDGSPLHPDSDTLWRMAEDVKATIFGTSASFLTECMKTGLKPGDAHDLTRLRAIGVTASPLSPEGFEWVYDKVKPDVWLYSSSGGTDVASAFVAGCPILPVHAGEIQCRGLGVDVHAVDAEGRDLIDEVGELVVRQPMPSMPLEFWNDPDGRRYKESYFEVFPGIWRHGDWLKITSRRTAVIYGRSDSTINRHGVRIGTSDIYRAVESIPEVLDSLVIELESHRGASEVVLFVVLVGGRGLDGDLLEAIRTAVSSRVSPRHVPDRVEVIPGVPRTLSGKKLEIPVKRILTGTPRHLAVSVASVANPEMLDYFVSMAETA